MIFRNRPNYKFDGLHELLKTDKSISKENRQSNFTLKSDDLFNLVYARFIINCFNTSLHAIFTPIER